ncbi:MAG TPA: ATP-dependent helicase [Acholeplasma sp.]|nr:ATP-dependent helicase [Acholeplasma sp.]
MILLNEEQTKAVYSKDQFIFLLAGAGSGKTRVIVERIKHLIETGINPKEILCITFTKKASLEMTKRLSDYALSIHTFHGYCYQQLAKIKTFKVFEHTNVFKEDEILEVSNYKNSIKTTKKPKIYDTYQKYLKERNLLDFDDLMMETIKHIKTHPYKYIFVDEFQDTNLLQFKLLETMIKKDTFCFTVGDPDQSIYAFRGARFELIDQFVKQYQASVLKLSKNYRSNDLIIDAANNLIKHNKNRFKKHLEALKIATNDPLIFIYEKDLIMQKVVELIKIKRLYQAVILYRNHYQVSYLKQLLEQNFLFDVRLLSFHESKGLEFDTVIIIGAEILPYDKDNIFFNKEEERRLFFVGITRAINNLYIFSTRKTKFLKETKLAYSNI